MVGRKGTSYEERRRKTLEENKKRMEQLNLNKLSQSLCKPKKKFQPRPPRQSVDLSLVRRSTRVADISFREKHAETIAQKKLDEDLTKDDSDSESKNSGRSSGIYSSNIFLKTNQLQLDVVLDLLSKYFDTLQSNFLQFRSHSFWFYKYELLNLTSLVGKAAGEEWRSMSDSDKAPYVAKAAKKKANYEKAKEEFKNRTVNGNGSTSTVFVNSSSEVHDEAEHEASS